MTFRNNTGECITAITSDGMLVIHSSPITLAGFLATLLMMPIISAESLQLARSILSKMQNKRAKQGYSALFEEWRVGDYLKFERNLGRAEVHTPEIDGHKVIRHDIRWK
jgi:hypothetical protein